MKTFHLRKDTNKISYFTKMISIEPHKCTRMWTKTRQNDDSWLNEKISKRVSKVNFIFSLVEHSWIFTV